MESLQTLIQDWHAAAALAENDPNDFDANRAAYDARYVAREFGLSPAQVSRIFTGKRRGYLHD